MWVITVDGNDEVWFTINTNDVSSFEIVREYFISEPDKLEKIKYRTGRTEERIHRHFYPISKIVAHMHNGDTIDLTRFWDDSKTDYIYRSLMSQIINKEESMIDIGELTEEYDGLKFIRLKKLENSQEQEPEPTS